MAPLSSTKLLWLLTILQQTLALSAHSPRDLEAFPAYNVVLSDRAVLTETALDLLAKGATVSATSASMYPGQPRRKINGSGH